MTPLDVVILCGGRGLRSYPDTVQVPKPLLLVGDRPIVEHVMGIYARQGHTRFVLAVGHLGELIVSHFAAPPPGWDVEIVDTGADTETGERLRRAAVHARGDRFFATYADGLADIELANLVGAHEGHHAPVTVTTVPLPSQYGTVVMDADDRITDFREKPRLDDHWINAGFMVVDRVAFEHWEGDVLERDVLPSLARRGLLFAYRHLGFWRSMDTFKDRQELTAMADAGEEPWTRAQSGLAAGDRTAR